MSWEGLLLQSASLKNGSNFAMLTAICSQTSCDAEILITFISMKQQWGAQKLSIGSLLRGKRRMDTRMNWTHTFEAGKLLLPSGFQGQGFNENELYHCKIAGNVERFLSTLSFTSRPPREDMLARDWILNSSQILFQSILTATMEREERARTLWHNRTNWMRYVPCHQFLIIVSVTFNRNI